MTAPLDVLAVMEKFADAVEAQWAVYEGAGELREARAAVAELVACVVPLATSLTARIDQNNAMSPQAVMVRRVNDALRAMGVQP